MSTRRHSKQREKLDTSKWLPRRHPSETLESAFFRRCHQIEQEITSRLHYEKTFNENNFDSGWALEEIIRQALRELLPRRYAVQSASISDSKGFTAGDCDMAIFNNLWFPVVKSGPTADSRRVYLPIEGVYAVIEVKQALTTKSLEDAMRKLVMCHRLFRPASPYDRLVENDYRIACTHYVSNPLFSSVIAAGLGDGVEMEAMVEKFIKINQTLPRVDTVRSLCVLGQGNVTWGYRPPSAQPNAAPELGPASFMTEDRFSELVPVYIPAQSDGSPFYQLAWQLLSHLFHSVLAPENIALYYGRATNDVRFPVTEGASLPPDPDLLNSLQDLCRDTDTSIEAAHGHSPAVRFPPKHAPHRGPCLMDTNNL
jgi:hypothetical protein